MSDLIQPDRATLENWLSKSHVEHYICSECEGLHVNAVQGAEGVVNSRIFVQQGRVLFSTELEIRPMAVLPLAADLGRMNMDYPSLKIFLDVVDDETPQLVAATHLLTGVGIDLKQFTEFVATTIDGVRLLAEECLQLDYLFAEAERPQVSGSRSVH